MSKEDKQIIFDELVELQAELKYTPLIYIKLMQKGYAPREWKSKEDDYT